MYQVKNMYFYWGKNGIQIKYLECLYAGRIDVLASVFTKQMYFSFVSGVIYKIFICI